MISITRRIVFDSGHRVYGHGGKCRYPHGHRYEAHITATADELDNLGMVIDFGVIKNVVGGWIDRTLDHSFMVWREDKSLIAALQSVDSRLFIMDNNPTAENIAKVIFEMSTKLLKEDPVRVCKVVVYETENCYAEITNGETVGKS